MSLLNSVFVINVCMRLAGGNSLDWLLPCRLLFLVFDTKIDEPKRTQHQTEDVNVSDTLR